MSIREIRKSTFLILGRPNGMRANAIFNMSMMGLIALNVLAVIFETVPSLAEEYGDLFFYFEIVSVVVFSIEYILRFWSTVDDPSFMHRRFPRIAFVFSPMAIIDLLAILPSIFIIAGAVDLRLLRVLRLFRLIRLLRIARYSLAIKRLAIVAKQKGPELMISWSLSMFMLVVASSLMYFVEHEVQPEKFSSIPATMWWAMATLTTVGYGDVYPITSLGKFLGACVAFIGIGLFALPAGIIASGFGDAINVKLVEEQGDDDGTHEICPKCGQSIVASDIEKAA